MTANRSSRRSFLVTLGSVVLGRFALPVGDLFGESPEPSENPVCEPVRRILTGPTWGGDRVFMIWLEIPPNSDEPTVMFWHPETPAERAEAERFFATATHRSWRTLDELKILLERPGPWLIRWTSVGYVFFLNTTVEADVFSPDTDRVLTADPSEAVRVTSRQALDIIPRLMREWELEDSDDYFEPVLPEDALRSPIRELDRSAAPSMSICPLGPTRP